MKCRMIGKKRRTTPWLSNSRRGSPATPYHGFLMTSIAGTRRGMPLADGGHRGRYWIRMRFSRLYATSLFRRSNHREPAASAVVGSGAGRYKSLRHAVSVVPDWPALRAEMIPRLDAIEAALRDLAPAIERFEVAYREHAQIGHNNPRGHRRSSN